MRGSCACVTVRNSMLLLNEIAGRGRDSANLCSSSMVLWLKDASSAQCPTSLRFSLSLPSAFTYDGLTYVCTGLPTTLCESDLHAAYSLCLPVSMSECQDPRNTLWNDVSYCKACYSGSAKDIIRAALCRLRLYSIRVRDQQFHFHLLCNLSERASDPLLVGRFSNTFCDQRRQLDRMS